MVATGGETESEKISKKALMQHIAEKNVVSAQMLVRPWRCPY